MALNMADLFEHAVDAFGDRTAVAFGDRTAVACDDRQVRHV